MQIKTKEELEIFICRNYNIVNDYIDQNTPNQYIPLYTSIDIREANNKFAPVDNNLYPAGFNNLCDLDLGNAENAFRHFFTSRVDQVNKKTMGIVTESHTKNIFYLENIYYLAKTLHSISEENFVISFDELFFPPRENSIELTTFSKKKIMVYKAMQKGNKVTIELDGKEKIIDLIVLNHDQSIPMNVNWSELDAQVFPSPFMGWYRRKKSTHFSCYQKVAEKFCEHFNIDLNLIHAQFSLVENVDFSKQHGLDNLASEVDKLLAKLPMESKVFVKGNQGTYGMGIMVVSSGEEILNMNRKERNKMDIGKNQIKFESVLIQESIETCLFHETYPAEVTIYCIGGKSSGGFLRANPLRDTQSNLNAKGMVFHRFCMKELKENQLHQRKEATYSIIARLSSLATALETQEMEK